MNIYVTKIKSSDYLRIIETALCLYQFGHSFYLNRVSTIVDPIIERAALEMCRYMWGVRKNPFLWAFKYCAERPYLWESLGVGNIIIVLSI